MVKRFENWPMLLSEYIKERKKAPFQWGYNDCLMFVSHGVERLTGHNFYEPYSNYTDEAGAKEVLAQNGGVIGIIKTCLGQGTTNILTAKRGDVAIIKLPEITAALVDDTGQSILVITEQGWSKLPLSRASRIWSY